MQFTADKPRLFSDLTEKLANDLMASARAEDDEEKLRYRADPLAWIVENLGVNRRSIVWSESKEYKGHRWDGTKDPLHQVLKALVTERRVGVESGTGTGKTFLLMCIIFWFLAVYEDSMVVTFAPKEKQLKLHVWKEIGRYWPKFERLFPGATLDELRIRMRKGHDDWSAHGYPVGVGASEESATKAQGFHAEHMLFIVEETPGVHGSIMNALLNTAVDEHNLILAVGNPDHQLDALHEFCTKVPEAKHIRISSLDHPNVVMKKRFVPGAVTHKSVVEKRGYYGENSSFYRSRVRGISPSESADALIKLEWIYRARDRGRALAQKLGIDDLTRLFNLNIPMPEEIGDYLALGVDVANSKTGDRGAIARGRGIILTEVPSFPCPDSNQLGGRVAIEMREKAIDPSAVGVDGVGVGAGTVNELMAQDFEVQNLMGNASYIMFVEGLGEEVFRNLRSQMYWMLREDLKNDRIILPDDAELFEELITPTWKPMGNKITVEPKEDLKKRLNGRSPNKADAVVYWNWVRQNRSITTGGGDEIYI